MAPQHHAGRKAYDPRLPIPLEAAPLRSSQVLLDVPATHAGPSSMLRADPHQTGRRLGHWSGRTIFAGLAVVSPGIQTAQRRPFTSTALTLTHEKPIAGADATRRRPLRLRSTRQLQACSLRDTPVTAYVLTRRKARFRFASRSGARVMRFSNFYRAKLSTGLLGSSQA
jgi:hypothetical protein